MPLTSDTARSHGTRPARGHRIAVVAAVAALGLAGCTSEPPTIASPLGTLEVIASGADAALANTFDPAATSIVGPHFALAVSGTEFTETLAPSRAAELGLDGGLIAPAGYDVMVVQIAANFDVDPAFGDEGGTEAVLELGEQTVELDNVPEAGDVIVAMAPTDADARLVVTDAGRRFSVNLREGVREEFVQALIDVPVDVGSYGSAGPYDQKVSMETDKWLVDINTYTEFELNKSAWLPDFEWAPDGKLWVQVDFTFQSLWKGDDIQVTWKLDPKKSLKLKAGDGVDAADAIVGEESGQMIDYSVVFPVDPATAEVTITFEPSGELRVIDGGDKDKPKVTDKANKKSYDVSF